MNERLIKKIEYLLNLGNNNSFEGEATSALEKAYALMRKYSISEEEVKYISKKDVLGDIDKEILTEEPRQFRKWEIALFSSICKLFDSQIIQNSRRNLYNKKSKLYVVGREANRRTAVIMYNQIHDKTIKEARQVGGRRASTRIAYCNGVVDAIASKVDLLKSQETVKTDAWGIIPINEVNTWILNNINNVKSTNFNTGLSRDERAYSAGISVGENTSLNRSFGFKAIEGKI